MGSCSSLSIASTYTMPSLAKAVAPKAKVVAPKAKSSPKVAKTTAPKKAEHPTYFEMIAAAITSMKDRRGSSRQAIRKYILENYKVDSVKMTIPLRLSLRNGLAKGKLRYAKETGKGSGCYKLVTKEKEAKKPAVKKVIKKDTEKKVADKKKVAAKKTTDKTLAKPAKKAVAKKKSSTAEKSMKKATSKKSPSKKPAAKKVVKQPPPKSAKKAAPAKK